MHTYKTLIIGGGMAGIGCAKRLRELGQQDFLLVTKDIGGRVPCSDDGDVNYGAYYVRKDYENLLPYVRLKRRIRISQYVILPAKPYHHILLQHLRHLPSLVVFLMFCLRVKHHYMRLKKKAAFMSQKAALEDDPLLLKLYTMPARELIKTMHIEYWTEHYFSPLTRFTAFSDTEDITALYFIGCIAPVFVPTYEFHLLKEKLISNIVDHIKHDQVVAVRRENGRWNVKLASGTMLHAEHVVMAIPIEIARKLIPIPEKINTPVRVHMTHLRGVLREKYRHGHYMIFPSDSADIVLGREQNGSYLLYSHTSHSHLEKYFDAYEVITTRTWDPAFRIGPHLIEAERGDNLYLIGDYIFSCMEDAFLTGIYAANQIGKMETKVIARPSSRGWKTLQPNMQLS